MAGGMDARNLLCDNVRLHLSDLIAIRAGPARPCWMLQFISTWIIHEDY